MTLALSIDRTLALARRVVVPLLVLLLMLPALAGASGSSPGDAAVDDTRAPPSGSASHPSGSGPPGPTPGDRYNRRLIDESERILRADGYFYDAWIREISYHDKQVDLRVTTRDVWT